MALAITPLQSAFSWLWDTFGKELVELGWDAAQWKRAADGYAAKIKKDYGKLFIYGKNTYVPIDDLFTYVQVLEQKDALFQFDEDKLAHHYVQRTLRYDPEARRNGWRMVQEGKNLFVLGDPGAGKTTFLKMAAIKAAQGELKKGTDVPPRIPIFIRLREHALSERTLYDSIKRELEVCGFTNTDLFVRKLLRSGRALLLWDALDEVKTEGDQRNKLVTEMHQLMRQYDGCQYVISCRVAAADYSFGERNEMQYIRMAPFDDAQIEEFLGKWFDEEKALAAECFTELTSNAHIGLHELARTPILLTLLAIAYKRTLGFPKRRMEIYYEAIDALLRGWDVERGIRRGEAVYGGLALGYKWDLMTEVAAEAFFDGDFLLTRQEWGERIRAFLTALPEISGGVDGGLVLDAIASKHGLFVKQTATLYSLAHLSFQEYFTARYIKEGLQHGSLEQLLDHINDDQWREVFLLTASTLKRKDAPIFFNLFIARLNGMVADIEPVQEILQWVMKKQVAYSQWDAREREGKATDSERVKRAVYEPPALRDYYQSRALDLIHVRPSALPPPLLPHAPTPALSLARALDITLILARNSVLNRNRRVRNRTHNRVYPINYDSAFNHACELGLDEFADQLKLLSIPDENDPQEMWDNYMEHLGYLIDDFRYLSGIDKLYEPFLIENEALDNIARDGIPVETYTAYINGTLLLQECLQLAMVSNRKEIEAQLLLPA